MKRIIFVLFFLLFLFTFFHQCFLSPNFVKVEMSIGDKKINKIVKGDEIIKFYSEWEEKPRETPPHVEYIPLPSVEKLAEGFIAPDTQKIPEYLKNKIKITKGNHEKSKSVLLFFVWVAIFLFVFIRKYSQKDTLTYIGTFILVFLTINWFILMNIALLSLFFNIKFIVLSLEMAIFSLFLWNGKRLGKYIDASSYSLHFKFFILFSFIGLFLINILYHVPGGKILLNKIFLQNVYHLSPFLLFLIPALITHPVFTEKKNIKNIFIIYFLVFLLILLPLFLQDYGLGGLLAISIVFQFMLYLFVFSWFRDYNYKKISAILLVIFLLFIIPFISYLFKTGMLRKIMAILPLKGRAFERLIALSDPFKAFYILWQLFQGCLLFKNSPFINFNFSDNYIIFKSRYLVTDTPLFLFSPKIGWGIMVLFLILKKILLLIILVKLFKTPSSSFKRFCIFVIPTVLFIELCDTVPMLGSVRLLPFTGVPSFLFSYSFFFQIIEYFFIVSFLNLDSKQEEIKYEQN